MATEGTEPRDEAGAEQATPPRRPTPMPAQEFQFWTPALALVLVLRQVRTVRSTSRLRGERR